MRLVRLNRSVENGGNGKKIVKLGGEGGIGGGVDWRV